MINLAPWYLKIARPLPWRKTHDPYRIWVSEVMLQQTQVDTVIGYYEKFLKTFPNLESLAKSKEQDVLTLWSGLGYYRRARNLRMGAKFIVKEWGKFPTTRDDILRVPGIGPYTAGAVLSIAFDLPEPLVDGNVNRLFARFFGVKEPIHTSKIQKFFWEMAEQWVKESQSPRIHNQALMELGSLVCQKSNPACHRCPLSISCVAFKKGLQQSIPLAKPRKRTEEIHWIGLVIKKLKHDGTYQYFIKQNQKNEWWEGLWDFPVIDKPLKLNWNQSQELIHQKHGQTKAIRPINRLQHFVTHHKISITSFIVEFPSKKPFKEQGQWLPLDEISKLPLSALAKKIFREISMC